MNFVTVIMAAGKGTRMNSDLPKVLHPVGGRPMVEHVLELARQIGSERSIVIVGHQAEKVKKELKNRDAEFVLQEPQLGTGHAVMQTEPLLKGYAGDVLVLSGDVPLLSAATMTALYGIHSTTGSLATVLTTEFEDPSGYGRVVRDQNGEVLKIVEHKDATEKEREIREINAGIYFFKSAPLFEALKNVNNDNKQGEYYLPDVIKNLIAKGARVSAYTTPDSTEIAGVNTLEQLQQVERVLADRIGQA